jgi:hypothetical protein
MCCFTYFCLHNGKSFDKRTVTKYSTTTQFGYVWFLMSILGQCIIQLCKGYFNCTQDPLTVHRLPSPYTGPLHFILDPLIFDRVPSLYTRLPHCTQDPFTVHRTPSLYTGPLHYTGPLTVHKTPSCTFTGPLTVNKIPFTLH